ncbi:MAG TPA: M14 family metallopeptidase [Myxococcota bacterium]|jgi:murein tripeptide amidase MpaA|nr:M14 family metallopeptidase [Myxococcota bacterium]
MPYLNVDEVESALTVATSAPFTGFTQLITLPNQTWEGRTSHAMKIGNGSGASRPGVFLLGGAHAREWGSADILINFVEQLEQAYQGGTGLTFGTRTFSAADIKTIVDTLDIVVFPQANPDGRKYSMDVHAMWRKNRRTAAPNSNTCPGVDVNRNYDFLWDFPTYFSSQSGVVNSTDPCDAGDPDNGTFIGPNAFSEPESKNAKWIFDNFSNLRFFMDLHSYGQDILYSWGDDQDQSSDPTMNFQNAAFNGARGVKNDAYKEYIPADDLSKAIAFAQEFHDGIQAVRGTNYTVKSAYDLYPTAGTSDDYAYSRSFVDPSKSKILSYVLEWGTEFQPPYSEMQNIIQEITCGLLALCLRIRTSITGCVVVTDRSTFGKDEVDAMLAVASPAVVPAAFYVVVDGFNAAELGITAATLTGVPNVAPALSLSPALAGMTVQTTACTADDPSLPAAPQRFTWTCSVTFANTTAFTAESVPTTLTASITSGSGMTVSGQAVLTLTTQPNPYEIDGATSWLSVDLQVFQILQGGSLPSTPGVALTAGPNDFITRLLANTNGGYNDPALARAPNHPYDLDLLANQSTSTVSIAGKVGTVDVYNFAVARVRYRALSTPAPNVRAFFRLFQCSTTSTDFQPTTTYLTGGQGTRKIPLLGVVNGELVSIPCFAEPRADPTKPNALNAQKDPTNVGPLGQSIPPDGTGAEVQVYFGCWLDINQTTAVLPATGVTGANAYTPTRSVQDVIRGQHQCLVAEINLDPPEPQIATGVSPATSDKLAQRNLTIVGVASPHQVPVTFDVKPTAATLPPGQTPDEIMIDWGGVPAGSQASLYLPGTSADAILATANKLYARHGLARSDAHTLTCTASGITYLPIPPGVGSNYAGLLTIDLPETVKRGQAFKVVTRQLRNVFAKRPAAPPPRPGLKASASEDLLVVVAKKPDLIEWRRVVGTFQVTIPVETKPALLPVEERLLSVLRWIARSIPVQDRWHPVFQRYLRQVAGRVSALGGDPAQIDPSSSGEGRRAPPRPTGSDELVCATGKVAALLFDRFGDFDGFVLDTAHGDRKYLSREKNLAELAERAWRERLRVTVCAQRHAPHRPESIIVHHPPISFG